jgi:multidrug efflux pump subunit AcrB
MAEMLQVYLGTERVQQVAPQLEELKRLKVRNKQGEMVPLSGLVTVRAVDEVAMMHRHDRRPAVTISANLAAGVSAAEARKRCEELAEEVRKEMGLTGEYRLSWGR